MLKVQWQPHRKQLRMFALGLGVLMVAGAARGWHHHPGVLSGVLGGAGLALVGLGLVAPSRVRGLYLLWLAAVAPLGWVVSYLLLAALYFLVITPIGLTLRLLGRDPLRLRRSPNRRTFWYLRRQPESFESYRRQA